MGLIGFGIMKTTLGLLVVNVGNLSIFQAEIQTGLRLKRRCTKLLPLGIIQVTRVKAVTLNRLSDGQMECCDNLSTRLRERIASGILSLWQGLAGLSKGFQELDDGASKGNRRDYGSQTVRYR